MQEADIICEFLEIAIHNVLFARKLYPDSIFERKRKYGVVVYRSVYPSLNEYIANCIKAISYHLRNNQLKNILLCFSSDQRVLEKYSFQILHLNAVSESDPFLVKLEQHLSTFFLKLHSSLDKLDNLPEDASFTIQLQVTEFAHLEYKQDPLNENFLWVAAPEYDNSSFPVIAPLHSVNTGFVHFQILVEKPSTVKGIFKRGDLEDSLSASDWSSHNDHYKSRRRNRIVKLDSDPLLLTCEWDSCYQDFTEFVPFVDHLKQHLHNYSLVGDGDCCWTGCTYVANSIPDLNQHLCYHAYHTKLKCRGKSVLYRTNLPECTLTEHFVIPVTPDGYLCEWEYCNERFETIFELFEHVRVHIYHNPKNHKQGNITCCWKGCTNKTKFRTQCKLAEHMRMHTKEKMVACPTCGNLFSNVTKFCDHRRRQLPINLQSYLCSQCSKYFPSERLLRDHMRLHINHYKCSMCEMTCPKPSILAKHIRYKHLSERPFKCNYCDYECVSKHNLDFHVKTHDPESEYKCSDCGYECRSQFGLDRHYQKAHGKDLTNVYECHNCKKQFMRGGFLTKHLMKVHNYHWPSGHSRFRYKEDADGIYRLQTVRYETLDVTEEIIKGKTVQAPSEKESLNFNVVKKTAKDSNSLHTFEVVFSEKDETKSESEAAKEVLIQIDDLDTKGQVVKSQTIHSICADLEEISDCNSKEIVAIGDKTNEV
ncbi:Histone H4 transcription factor-like Protein [Tribolium castaneum]|uniref:Histone H4 transcription factor-like Protein n=2 Tax=Tribolium castaneum TaxID=7070 RepID=A0A139WHL6_TRICA|nr:Histone H4 transcription factor-like Protein [Tribolium castaneum]